MPLDASTVIQASFLILSQWILLQTQPHQLLENFPAHCCERAVAVAACRTYNTSNTGLSIYRWRAAATSCWQISSCEQALSCVTDRALKYSKSLETGNLWHNRFSGLIGGYAATTI